MASVYPVKKRPPSENPETAAKDIIRRRRGGFAGGQRVARPPVP